MKKLYTVLFITFFLFWFSYIRAQKVSSGPGCFLYICPDSTISAIGLNQGLQFGDKIVSSYQLGDGTNIDRYYPVKVKGLHDVTGISALTSMAVLADGSVWKWTDDSGYNLHKIEIDSVVAVTGGISAEMDWFYCALKKDGSLWLWGNSKKKDSHWWNYTDSMERMDIPKVKKVAAGQYCVIALCEDGSVWTWGNIHVDGNRNDVPENFYIYKPSRVFSITDVVDVGAGSMNVFALKSDGTIWEWGMEQSYHTVGHRSSPVKEKISGVKSMWVGYQDALYAIKEDGSLWHWPDSTVNSTHYSRMDIYPKKIEIPVTFEEVYASQTNAFALDNFGNKFRWGSNADGQLGNFTNFPIDYPEIMPHPCMAVDCDTITMNPDVFRLDTAVYPGEPVKLTSSLSEADLYWWYPRSNVISGKYERTATVSISDDLGFTAVIMDTYGCMRKERFNLRKKCNPTIKTKMDSTTYQGAQINLFAGEGTGFLWTPVYNLTCTDCRSNSVAINDSISYLVTYSDTFNCPARERFIFRIRDCDTIIKKPDSLLLDTLITPGSSVTLSASVAETYLWTPAEGLNCNNCKNPVAHIYPNTEYTATLSDSYHCTWTERFKITNHCDSTSVLNPDLVLDTVTWPDSRIELNIPEGNYYTWEPTDGLNCTNCINPVANTIHSVEYTGTVNDLYNCQKKFKFRIGIRNCDTIITQNNVVILDTIIHYTSDISLMASESFEAYNWNPSDGLSCSNCQNPVLTARKTGNYVVEIFDSWHCPYNQIFNVTMISHDVEIPNVFTPNGDGRNDYFEIKGLVPGSTLKIFDSRGKLVFITSDFADRWDGLDKSGNICNEETYWYILDVPEKGTFQGWVYLKNGY